MQDWHIQSRALVCSATGRPFVEGEKIASALFWKDGAYQRVDMTMEAWAERNDNVQPLCAWQPIFEAPVPGAPETLKKDDAESLLRRLMEENDPAKVNARYILALMLERKRMLRPIDSRESEQGQTHIVYEHQLNGETWIIEDPKLRLDQLEPVQDEVAELLKSAVV